VLRFEGSKPYPLNLVASDNGFNNHINQGIQRLSGITLGLTRFLGHSINQFRFVH